MYDVIHFEALGVEAQHLQIETDKAIANGLLTSDHSTFITPLTLQEHTIRHPETRLPDIITIKTHSKIPQPWLNSNGIKKGIISRSAGYDHLEHLTKQAHITSLREYCVAAVAQTAMKFLYATAGMLNHFEKLAATFERNTAPSFMELGSHRTATVFGVGKIGKAIYELLVANGLNVYGVDIRAKELSQKYGNTVRFMEKEDAITKSDIVINAMNLTREEQSPFYNIGYFSSETFSHIHKPIIFINVTRGEIAPEEQLLEALNFGRIIGLGLDVFSDEAEFSQVLKGKSEQNTTFAAAQKLLELSSSRCANVYVQPHQGFNSDLAVLNKASETIKHLIGWFENDAKKFHDELPYY